MLPPFTRIGPYEIVGHLGSGGMGDVYRARDQKLGRDVAVKILPPSFAMDPERLARFEREARMLAAVNHPNIAAIYGLEERQSTDGGNAPITALVLELVEGATLQEQLRHGALPVGEAVDIARQLAEALDAAHERGIVHRDLKPANIAITSNGTVKVLDFGLAKAEAGGAGGEDLSHPPTAMATMDGVLLGTAPYMSPEQARGRSVDKRTDIWAFGCVLYELLTGRCAFGGDTTSDTIAAILEREPEWTAIPVATPPRVVHLVRRCLDKNPKRRLRDIGDAIAVLDEDGFAPAAPTQAARGSSRTRAGWLAAAVSLVAAIGIAGFWIWSRATPGPSVSRLVRLTSGPVNDFSPAISPDSKWVAYLSDARGVVDVWVKFVTGGAPVNLTASTSLDVAPQIDSGGLSVSPDGSLIAFNATVRGGGSPTIGTWVVPAPLGGVPQKLLDVGRAARWSPDGRRIAFIVQGGTGGDAIWIADADGANPRELAPKRGGMHKHWAAWSRDSAYIYFNYSATGANAEPSSLYRVPAAGGPIEPVIETARRAMFPAPTSDSRGLIYAANPQSVDLGLWWKPLAASAGDAQKLTIGVGEYAEPTLSADGTRIVATLFENRQFLISVAADSEIPVDRAARVTDGETGDINPALSPDGSRLVFSSTRSGNRNLWIARGDGSDARPLTSGDFIDEWPAFSADGRQIAFVSDRGGERGIWLISADGGSPRFLINALVLDNISRSRDSQRIVYAVPGDDAPRLSMIAVATRAVTQLSTPGPASGPVWSPTADIVAYIETRAAANAPTTTRVAFVDASGRPLPIAAARPPDIGNSLLAWDPGGRFLAVGGNSGSTKSVAWIIEPGDAATLRRITEFPSDSRIRGLTFSHDGKSLIIGRHKRSGDLVLMDLAR